MPPRRKRKAPTREETKLKKQKDECLTRYSLQKIPTVNFAELSSISFLGNKNVFGMALGEHQPYASHPEVVSRVSCGLVTGAPQ